MRTSARTRYAGYRFPAEIIGHAVWLYFRFPLGLRMVEELLAARGIIVSHETVRQWARKFGQPFANQIRRRLPRVGDKWHDFGQPFPLDPLPSGWRHRRRGAQLFDNCAHPLARDNDPVGDYIERAGEDL